MFVVTVTLFPILEVVMAAAGEARQVLEDHVSSRRGRVFGQEIKELSGVLEESMAHTAGG